MISIVEKIETMEIKTPKIRPMVLTLVRRNNEILVSCGENLINGKAHYRPLGGGIDFGELSADCVAREMLEEINIALTKVTFLKHFECIYETSNGTPRHDLILMYEAKFKNEADYKRESYQIDEPYFTKPVFAEWLPISAFQSGELILHPRELIELL
jgi:8-oxo-dGTP pyrophosphatase MutT (NUDIX family)